MQGSIHALPVVAAAFEFSFMGGSMGSVVGERFVRGVQVSLEQKCPFICFAASGGARMQEGLLSLMQMAKTCAALTQLSQERLPFISVLTDPTMGGVSASFAFMGDVVIAEPGALIGFAGARVIQQTVRETLPEGFQRAEFLLEHGAIDMIIDRREMKNQLATLITLLTKQSAVAEIEAGIEENRFLLIFYLLRFILNMCWEAEKLMKATRLQLQIDGETLRSAKLLNYASRYVEIIWGRSTDQQICTLKIFATSRSDLEADWCCSSWTCPWMHQIHGFGLALFTMAGASR